MEAKERKKWANFSVHIIGAGTSIRAFYVTLFIPRARETAPESDANATGEGFCLMTARGAAVSVRRKRKPSEFHSEVTRERIRATLLVERLQAHCKRKPSEFHS